MAASSETIRLLADQIRQLESSFRLGEPVGIPLGNSGLADLFPHQSLATGSLVELLACLPGAGAWSFALRLASYACGERKTLLIVDPERSFYPPAARKFGLEVSRTVIVRPRNARDALLALGQALRCSAIGAAIGKFDRLQDRDARRLQLAAEAGGAIGVLLRPKSAQGVPSFASVRLLMDPLPSWRGRRRMRVEVLRSRSSSPLDSGGRGELSGSPASRGSGEKILEIDDATGHVRAFSPLELTADLASPARSTA